MLLCASNGSYRCLHDRLVFVQVYDKDSIYSTSTALSALAVDRQTFHATQSNVLQHKMNDNTKTYDENVACLRIYRTQVCEWSHT